MRVIGDLSRVNARRYPQKIALAHGERVLGIGFVSAGHHDGGDADLLELVERLERSRPRHALERVGHGAGMLVGRKALP